MKNGTNEYGETYVYYISIDESSYGESTPDEIEEINRRETQICNERGIEIIECDPMLVDESRQHPDSESIFEEAAGVHN